MTYEEINDMMAEMGLPFAYHHFAEGDSPRGGEMSNAVRQRGRGCEPSPAPPFLLFLSPGEDTFSADNVAYHSFKQLDIELYTDKKNPALEEEIEVVLTQHEIYFTKTESWIASEKMYEVLYEMTI